MDEKFQKQLLHQIKILNFWVTFFGVIVVVSLVIFGFLIFKLVSYVHDTTQKVETLQQQTKENLNLKNQVCKNDKISNLLDKKTEVCD